jgi:hypothetical protein
MRNRASGVIMISNPSGGITRPSLPTLSDIQRRMEELASIQQRLDTQAQYIAARRLAHRHRPVCPRIRSSAMPHSTASRGWPYAPWPRTPRPIPPPSSSSCWPRSAMPLVPRPRRRWAAASAPDSSRTFAEHLSCSVTLLGFVPMHSDSQQCLNVPS